MNRLPVAILFALSVLSSPVHTRGQGNLQFDNIGYATPQAPVTINTATGAFNPADGSAGAYVGSNYTASLFFLNGTVTNQAVFDSSDPFLFAFAGTPFLGMTGTNGSGLFEGGQIYLSAASGRIVTVQVRAWYNGSGQYTSYAEALAAGQNVGESNPVPLFLAIGLQPPSVLSGLLPFAVGVIPEPSPFALVGLGGLALVSRLILRRPQSSV